MKTLFENLKEEHLLQLKEMEKKYPNSYAAIVKELKEKTMYSYLTISDAYTLLINTTNKGLSLTNLSELFYE